MRVRTLHRWDLTPREAREVQERLRGLVAEEELPAAPQLVAGVDVHFERGGRTSRAAVAVLRCRDFEAVEEAIATLPTAFPYVPGLLSFRELPAVLAALEQLSATPDLFVCDAHGLAHPRRFGLACHLGVLTNTPTIGVAKSRLVGEHGPLSPEKGAWVPLTDDGETIGAVVRTRAGVKPVYVSVGHRVRLSAAIDLTLLLTTRYRLPEPARTAHRLAAGG